MVPSPFRADLTARENAMTRHSCLPVLGMLAATLLFADVAAAQEIKLTLADQNSPTGWVRRTRCSPGSSKSKRPARRVDRLRGQCDRRGEPHEGLQGHQHSDAGIGRNHHSADDLPTDRPVAAGNDALTDAPIGLQESCDYCDIFAARTLSAAAQTPARHIKPHRRNVVNSHDMARVFLARAPGTRACCSAELCGRRRT